METLSITEVCRRTGLSARALRFYETRRLLASQRSAAGQRRYGASELARLHQIVALKSAGFTLARIGELLDGRGLDLAALIDAQLGSVATQRAELEAVWVSLHTARTALDQGRVPDLDTFCTIIKQGASTMTDTEAWQQVYDSFYTLQEQAEWSAVKQRAFEGVDWEVYTRDWKQLTDRIDAALPLDPNSPVASALLAEWRTLQAPFEREAAPLLAAGAVNLYDRIDEWADLVEPPFSKAVWQAMTAAAAAQAKLTDYRVGTGVSPE